MTTLVGKSLQRFVIFISLMANMAYSQTTTSTPSAMVIVLGYTPNIPGAWVAAFVYVIIGLLLTWRVIKLRTWWGFCLPIGAIGSGVGFFARIAMVKSHPNSKGIFILQQILIVCMPAFFLAFEYILSGRLIATSIGRRHSLIKPSLVSWIFVLSDVTTFVVQAGGAAMLANSDKFATGKKVLQAGIILQAASFYIFVFFLAWTHYSVKREGLTNGRESWWKAVYALYFSSLFIIIRSIYRVVQSSEPRGSTISTHEIYFYMLDVLMLVISIATYVFFWPAKYMKEDSIVSQEAYKLEESRFDRSKSDV